jgi:Flp pilus assembly protein TadB
VEQWLKNLPPIAIALDERLIVALFAATGLFIGLILTDLRRRKNDQAETTSQPDREWDRPPQPVSGRLILLAFLAGGVVPGIILTFALGPVLGIPSGILLAWAVPSGIVNNARRKWIEAIDTAALSLLQLIILKLQSGQSLLPALDEMTRSGNLAPILSRELDHFVVAPVSGGASLPAILAQLRDSPRYANTWRLRRIFRHLSTATRAQMPAHKIAIRLELLQDALVNSYALQLELESDLAQAKYSRWIVAATLPITVIAFNFFAPDIAENLFVTIPGQIAIVFAVMMVVLLNIVGSLLAKLKPLEL